MRRPGGSLWSSLRKTGARVFWVDAPARANLQPLTSLRSEGWKVAELDVDFGELGEPTNTWRRIVAACRDDLGLSTTLRACALLRRKAPGWKKPRRFPTEPGSPAIASSSREKSCRRQWPFLKWTHQAGRST